MEIENTPLPFLFEILDRGYIKSCQLFREENPEMATDEYIYIEKVLPIDG